MTYINAQRQRPLARLVRELGRASSAGGTQKKISDIVAHHIVLGCHFCGGPVSAGSTPQGRPRSPSVAPLQVGGPASVPVGAGPPRDLRCSSDPRRTPPPPHAHRRMGARPRPAIGTASVRGARGVLSSRELEEGLPDCPGGGPHTGLAHSSQAGDTLSSVAEPFSSHPRRRSLRPDPPSSAPPPSPPRSLPLSALPRIPPLLPTSITAPLPPPPPFLPPPHVAAMAFVGTFVPSPSAVLRRGAAERVSARPVARSATTVTMRASKSVPFMEVPPALAENPNMPGNVGMCQLWVCPYSGVGDRRGTARARESLVCRAIDGGLGVGWWRAD